MLKQYPALSGKEGTDHLVAVSRPLLDGSTEALAFTDAALIAKQAELLGISQDFCRFIKRLALAVKGHHPRPCGAHAQEPLPKAIAGCGVVDSSDMDGGRREHISADGADEGLDAVLAFSPLSPSAPIDPALRQESLLVKAFPHGLEVSIPDPEERLDDLCRRVLAEIQDLFLLTRFRQLVARLLEANELENVRPLEQELLKIVQKSEACAQQLSQLAWYPWRTDSDPAFRAFVERRGGHLSHDEAAPHSS